MAERDSFWGNSKSRIALGDLTNRVDGRRVSGKEKRVDFKDKDAVKRIRVLPRFGTKINSLEGRVTSGLSDENKNPNLQRLDNINAASRSSVDADLNCDGSDWLKGENVLMESSKFQGENDGITTTLSTKGRQGNNVAIGSSGDAMILGVDGSESRIVSNNVVGDCGKIDRSDDVCSPMTDKIASQEDTKADGSGELHSSKWNTLLGISEVVMENRCSRIEFSLGETVADYLPASSKLSDEENDPDSVDLGRGREHAPKANVELHERFVGNNLRSSCINITEKENNILEGTQSDGINVDENELDDDQNADNLILSQSSSFDPESSSAVGADRSPKEGDYAYVSGGTESIRACSCSFCTKAAQVWLDLHYQDIKGRVSAIRKSQKEAGRLSERSCGNKVAEKHSAERSTEVRKMESHLMNQWRCLFEGMAGIWEEEGNSLESSLQSLAELRNKSKADLSLIDSKPKPSEDDQH